MRPTLTLRLLPALALALSAGLPGALGQTAPAPKPDSKQAPKSPTPAPTPAPRADPKATPKPATKKPGAKPEEAAPAPVSGTVTAADKILSDLATTGNAAAARSAAQALLRTLAESNAPVEDLVVAARTLRLVALASDALAAPPKDPKAGKGKPEASVQSAVGDPAAFARVLGMFRESPGLAESLAWAYIPGKDRADKALAIVEDLRAHNLPTDRYPELTAALAFVHDSPDPRAQEWSPSPAELFAFYTDGRRLLMSPDTLPEVLLTHLVDCVVSRDEMAWAFGRFRGNARVGAHYKEVHYDTPFFKGQQPKKMEGKAYTLENILKFGGVCVEQAYFAEMIGKSIGIPTATVTARGDSVGHAWIGFLLKQNRGWSWDLTEGRYDDYEGEQADVRDPQTGGSITDAELNMKADRASMDQALVRDSLAMADAAAVMSEAPAALAMMERAVNACPFVPAAWERLADMAGKKKLAPADLERWGLALVTLCGTKYPDFAVKILDPLIKTMPEASDRAACWAWARGQLVDAQKNRSMLRNDLAVSLRVREGDCWRDGQDEAAAWEAYHEAIRQFGKKTPAVQAAADRCDRMLRKADKPPKELVDFWAWAWRQTDKPSKMSAEFALGSNWSVFGLRYAEALEKAGDHNRAEQVRRDIMPKDK